MRKKIFALLVSMLFLSGCAASRASSTVNGFAPASLDSANTESIPLIAGFGLVGEPDEAPVSEQTTQKDVPTEQADTTQATEPPKIAMVASDPDDFIYVSYSKEAISCKDADGAELLIGSVKRAEIVTEDESLNGWLDSIQAAWDTQIQSNIDEMLQWATEHRAMAGEQFYTYSYYDSSDVQRLDQRIVSVLTSHSQYSGGAHPSNFFQATNLDLGTKRELTLNDVIDISKKDLLFSMILEQIDNKYWEYGEGSFYPDYREIALDELENDPRFWYFSRTGMVFFFNPYELAPYAAGVIQIEIPYVNLYSILKDEYFPEAPKGDGTLRLVGPSASQEVIDVCEGESGQSVLVSSDQTISILKIDRLQWVGETAVSDDNLFMASKLTSNKALQLCLTTEESVSYEYCITIADGSENGKTYLLGHAGLKAE